MQAAAPNTGICAHVYVRGYLGKTCPKKLMKGWNVCRYHRHYSPQAQQVQVEEEPVVLTQCNYIFTRGSMNNALGSQCIMMCKGARCLLHKRRPQLEITPLVQCSHIFSRGSKCIPRGTQCTRMCKGPKCPEHKKRKVPVPLTQCEYTYRRKGRYNVKGNRCQTMCKGKRCGLHNLRPHCTLKQCEHIYISEPKRGERCQHLTRGRRCARHAKAVRIVQCDHIFRRGKHINERCQTMCRGPKCSLHSRGQQWQELQEYKAAHTQTANIDHWLTQDQELSRSMQPVQPVESPEQQQRSVIPAPRVGESGTKTQRHRIHRPHSSDPGCSVM